MNGKDKCRILKDIRREIALKNDIEWVVSECQHKGACKGTCPKCESEVRRLEHELSIRRKLGKAVALTGISAVCAAGLSGCSVEDVISYGEQMIGKVQSMIQQPATCQPTEEIELDGEVAYYPDDDLSGYVAY